MSLTSLAPASRLEPTLRLLARVRAEKDRRQAERDRQLSLAAETQDRTEEIRENCRTLRGFIAEAWPVLEPGVDYVPNWHIDAISDHLEGITAGHITRLQINQPPGTMKSLTASVMWPAWEWGPASMPWLRYLGTSYDADYAARDSRKHRDLTLSPWYQTFWPIQLLRTGEGDFENTARGSRAAKVFANLTGGRGNRVILDDPHSIDTIESANERMKVTRRFRDSLQSRLNDAKRDAILVIMHRLDPKDVCGVIDELGLAYTKLVLPMEYERKYHCVTHFGGKTFNDPRKLEGELLFPKKFPAEVVKIQRTAMTSHAYAGQYQQHPSAREGGMFKRQWFQIVEAMPVSPRIRKVRRWDLAASIPENGSDPDWTVGLKMAAEPAGDGHRFYIEDVIRFREQGHIVRRTIKSTAIADSRRVPIEIPQDPGQAGKDQAKNIIAESAGFRMTAERETGDKGTRAEPFAAQCEAGNVYLVRGDWNDDFIEELCSFGLVGHDDQVDAAAGAFNFLTDRKGQMKITDELLASSTRRGQ